VGGSSIGKSFTNGDDLLPRYTQQLNEQEPRLETLRKESAQLEQESAIAQDALDKTIAGLTFDVRL
jgi:hypothetical protein